jgi:hypothetical protein
MLTLLGVAVVVAGCFADWPFALEAEVVDCAAAACARALWTTAGSCLTKSLADWVLPIEEMATPIPNASGPRRIRPRKEPRTRRARIAAARKRTVRGTAKRQKPMPCRTDE